MAEDNPADVVVPVISEELHADAVPVQTGSVRVVKRVEGHEEVLEQELKKGRVEVKRVKTDRIVDGPQQSRREGNTLIVPVVSEVLHVERRWVVTEEIHLTQLEERETVQERVTVNQEVADIQRFDEGGNPVSTVVDSGGGQRPGLKRPLGKAAGAAGSTRKVLSNRNSLLK